MKPLQALQRKRQPAPQSRAWQRELPQASLGMDSLGGVRRPHQLCDPTLQRTFKRAEPGFEVHWPATPHTPRKVLLLHRLLDEGAYGRHSRRACSTGGTTAWLIKDIDVRGWRHGAAWSGLPGHGRSKAGLERLLIDAHGSGSAADTGTSGV